MSIDEYIKGSKTLPVTSDLKDFLLLVGAVTCLWYAVVGLLVVKSWILTLV
jgi:hypothetical protein